MVGIGTVGLPVALAFARRFPGTLAYDVDRQRVAALQATPPPGLRVTAEPAELLGADFFIVAVPTGLRDDGRPDFRALEAASRTVGRALRPGAVVVYESTVYPGATEGVCGQILERESGLRCGRDFTLGYSPERINPGDPVHDFEHVVKVVAGQDAATLELIARCYAAVVPAGVHRAPSIAVAEASKALENAQRDLNIALMNELARLCDRLNLDTQAVLAAAGTKWNFVRFTPGLVGGPCLALGSHYLAEAARQAGLDDRLFLAARRVNQSMSAFVAERLRLELAAAGRAMPGARVAVLGLSFKEEVADVRASRAADLVLELVAAGAAVLVHDPLADAAAALQLYGIALQPAAALRELDAVVLAVPHRGLGVLALRLLHAAHPAARAYAGPAGGAAGAGWPEAAAVLVDVKAAISPDQVPAGVRYWRL